MDVLRDRVLPVNLVWHVNPAQKSCINDAPSLYTVDVRISVKGAVDVTQLAV